ncbi:MAG: hypothetical protein IJK29_00575 [Bacteroidales bacterium]|nr:hypothetical protein [Bacteroidales bacterium]
METGLPHGWLNLRNSCQKAKEKLAFDLFFLYNVWQGAQTPFMAISDYS